MSHIDSPVIDEAVARGMSRADAELNYKKFFFLGGNETARRALVDRFGGDIAQIALIALDGRFER